MIRLMKAALRRWHPLAIALSASVTVVVLGCGDESGLGKRYKVTGRVTYKGENVAHGTVNFTPTKPAPPEGRAATGELTDGYYSLSTAGNNDGALPGEYKVAITAKDIDFSAAKPKDGGAIIRQGSKEQQAAIKAGKSLIPTKYSLSETSGLTATVKEESNNFDFPLTD
jgi:hypothetical protein